MHVQMWHVDKLHREALDKLNRSESKLQDAQKTCTGLQEHANGLEVKLAEAVAKADAAQELRKTVDSLQSCIQVGPDNNVASEVDIAGAECRDWEVEFFPLDACRGQGASAV